MRPEDENGKIHCCFVTGKSRVALLPYIATPTMELVAATLSLKMSVLLKKELQFNCKKEVFWTNSESIWTISKMNKKDSKFCC